MTNCCKFCLFPEKTASNTTERNSTGRRSPPPSGPTLVGPHCFWVVVCAVCAAPDSAACLLLFLLLVFLMRLAAAAVFAADCACCCFWAADRRTPPPLPPLKRLTFQNVNYNLLQSIETKCAGIPTEFPREDTPICPSHLPATTLRSATPLGFNCSGFASLPHSRPP